jgi:hypothetical protein
MKTRITGIFAAAIVMIVFSTNAFGQASATANASASIVAPIAISNTTALSFGNVAVSTSPGTVVLVPAGTRSATGGVTLPGTTGTVTAAVFNVTGTPAYTYTIALPASITVTRTTGTETMTVDTFTSDPSVTGTLDGTGAQELRVGATLNVAGSQVAGIYESTAPFTVTVNYN